VEISPARASAEIRHTISREFASVRFSRESAGLRPPERSRPQPAALEYGNEDSWEKMLEQGQDLLRRFQADQRIRIEDGRRDLQVRLHRPLTGSVRDFLGYIDALGWVDGIHCVIERKTSTLGYPESTPRVLELESATHLPLLDDPEARHLPGEFRAQEAAGDSVSARSDP
jgi:hypothetical protein